MKSHEGNSYVEHLNGLTPNPEMTQKFPPYPLLSVVFATKVTINSTIMVCFKSFKLQQ